jgi:hypothetical protein
LFFHSQLLGVNTVVYLVALAVILYTGGRVLQRVSRLAGGRKDPDPPSAAMLRRCLTLGGIVAVLSAVLWAVSGFVFPAWMHYVQGAASRLTPEHYSHFIVSNLLCGMIAATQTYYVVTFMCLRYCYPWLLQARQADARDTGDLADLVRRGRIFLGVTLSVPFLALPAVVLINFHRGVIAGLGGVGLVGCGVAYLLDLAIRADASALAAAINPSGDPLSVGDTADSFLSGTR